jgi:hypothetical protein
MIKIMKIDKVIIINVLCVHVIRYIIKIHRFVHIINAIAIKINTKLKWIQPIIPELN